MRMNPGKKTYLHCSHVTCLCIYFFVCVVEMFKTKLRRIILPTMDSYSEWYDSARDLYSTLIKWNDWVTAWVYAFACLFSIRLKWLLFGVESTNQHYFCTRKFQSNRMPPEVASAAEALSYPKFAYSNANWPPNSVASFIKNSSTWVTHCASFYYSNVFH